MVLQKNEYDRIIVPIMASVIRTKKNVYQCMMEKIPIFKKSPRNKFLLNPTLSTKENILEVVIQEPLMFICAGAKIKTPAVFMICEGDTFLMFLYP